MKRTMKKGVCIAIAVLVCAVIVSGWFAAASQKNERETVTTLSVDSIAEKFHNDDGYYLTVALEDWLIEEYNLSCDRVTFKTGQDIYDKVSPGDSYAGVTLRIREPEKCSNGDVRAVLKWDMSDLCEIISLGQKGE